MPTEGKLAIACIILAAGHSRRFGSPKMLRSLADGVPMIQATINRYLDSFDTVHVVVQAEDTQLAAILEPLPVTLVPIAANCGGMSQSLVAGVGATIDADAWLIALGDMPYLGATTVRRLCAELHKDNIVIPCFEGRRGNPVGFGSAFKKDLLALQGDSGARSVTRRAADNVVEIETGDEGVLLDIDYPAAIL